MFENMILDILSKEIGISLKQVQQTVELLEDGGTIPFISRYRKERTGGLDEVQVKSINDKHNELKELVKRKEYILGVINEAGKLTDDLRKKIEECWNAVELEDIYLPFKPKRKTRAEVARGYGLEPLARIIMSQNNADVESQAKKFISKNVPSVDDAIQGAQDIIAEWVSEKMAVRGIVRRHFEQSSTIQTKVIKGKEEEGDKYKNYFNLNESLRRCSSHRLLAILRAEREGILKLSVDVVCDDQILSRINDYVIKNNSKTASYIKAAVGDSYKRLLRPSIVTEVMNVAKTKADDVAIEMFAQNLRQLLYAPPLKNKKILAVDPGFRTGCKIVCLNETGKLLHNDVIYLNNANDSEKIKQLVEVYQIDAIALGNGTASRETESYLRELELKDVPIYVVNESGASIYSASDVAREEFPDKDVTVRGSVSIGRRLQDPLAELVKIDPKSIGVGQYQHDVDQKKLKQSLDFVVESCVNSVGVDLNTASKELLSYVSGIGPQLANNIVNYRNENGPFTCRKDLMNVPRLGAKVFQQSSAFLRIPESKNPLDNSAVHPESYKIVEKIAVDHGCRLSDLIGNKKLISEIDIEKYISNEIGRPTLIDIMNELEKPGRDPRGEAESFKFDENVKTINDIITGMTMYGKVTNITQFGVFVDIGIHENGLIHISELSDKYINSANDVVNLNQWVRVKVIDIDLKRKRISLSMKNII